MSPGLFKEQAYTLPVFYKYCHLECVCFDRTSLPAGCSGISFPEGFWYCCAPFSRALLTLATLQRRFILPFCSGTLLCRGVPVRGLVYSGEPLQRGCVYCVPIRRRSAEPTRRGATSQRTSSVDATASLFYITVKERVMTTSDKGVHDPRFACSRFRPL